MTEPTVLDHVFMGLVAAFILYAVVRGQPQMKGATFDTSQKLGVYWSNGILLWVGAIGAIGVWMLGGRSLPDLGLTWRHAAPGVGFAIAAAFCAWVTLETWHKLATPARRTRLVDHWRRDAPFLPETPRELAHFAAMAITAGITEEIVMRGFAISYLVAFTGTSAFGLTAAVALPAAAFAIAHRYEGWKDMLRIFVLSIAFGAIFVVTGSLLIPIVLHVLIDLGAGVLSWRLAGVRARAGIVVKGKLPVSSRASKIADPPRTGTGGCPRAIGHDSR